MADISTTIFSNDMAEDKIIVVNIVIMLECANISPVVFLMQGCHYSKEFMDRTTILSAQCHLSFPVGMPIVLMYSAHPKPHMRDGIAAGSDK
jgi:hypothetical protein